MPRLTPPPTSTSSSPTPTKYIPTIDAYDAWASVYDHDGNILQSVDDMELERMLPEFFKFIQESIAKEDGSCGRLHVVDLGCGTGRNITKLVEQFESVDILDVQLTGIDASKNMLAVAKEKVSAALQKSTIQKITVNFIHHNLLDPSDPSGPPILSGPIEPLLSRQDAMISTLVLEHFPLSPFFKTIWSLLRPGGIALVTNMHPHMGSRGQAGFVRTDTEGKKEKIRGESFIHGVEETIEAAKAEGLEVLGEVGERSVEQNMVGMLGKRSEKWIECKVWYGVILRKKI
jgi:SAM-dependent methyltransferase